ncbi:hypothetical protein K2O51_31835 (plasmid) [Cupriavidus pinatubonensis]|uniref:DUF6750 family protein n=1 Tax=Cupriavidus pinatubonensis TaxID=248026 RepID=UPI001C72B0E4|nr:DUF6750 family protein [Cupriavidus pinatubonensis]QYY33618.1 hypothetical protein K2O51_31835 [Cupriavidus pinatubonensis]
MKGIKHKASRAGASWSRWKGALARVSVALMGVNASKMAYAAGGVVGMLSNIDNASKATVTTLVNIAMVMGVVGVLYGLKLIKDKSNDRENVKMSQILLSLGGGAGLIIIWFVITMIVETAGGSSSDIGRQQSF